MFLRIENKVKEIPSASLLRMLGASASRGLDQKIGCFGSGFPQSCALLARHGLLENTKICLGKTVFTFDTIDHKMIDSNGNTQHQSEIRMLQQNGPTFPLNISTKFGELDWNNVTMAVREMVSNACDGSESYNGTYNTVKLEFVEDNQCRAKDDFIRVYIPLTEEIRAYIENIEHYFLCLKPGYDPKRSIIYNIVGGPAKIYRKGILVGEMGTKSLFNYNMPDVTINESRQVDTWTAKTYGALYLSQCDNPDIIKKFVLARLGGNREVWESEFSEGYVNPDNNLIPEKKKPAARAAWKDAIKQVVGHKVVCDNRIAAKMVEAKGMEVLTVDDSIKGIIQEYAEKSADKVLNVNEITGKVIVDAPDSLINLVDRVWNVLLHYDQTLGKSKPGVHCFVQHITEGAMAGYHSLRLDDGNIYIEKKQGDSIGTFTLQVVIEELTHYITKANDFTREFQSFAFNLAALLMKDNENFIGYGMSGYTMEDKNENSI